MRVTTHIRRGLEVQNARDITRRSLIVIPTRDGKSYYRSNDGEHWRTFVFVEGVQTFEAVQSPEQVLRFEQQIPFDVVTNSPAGAAK